MRNELIHSSNSQTLGTENSKTNETLNRKVKLRKRRTEERREGRELQSLAPSSLE
jgi:hypothetical protein